MSLTLGVSDVASWLDSDYASLAAQSQKYFVFILPVHPGTQDCDLSHCWWCWLGSLDWGAICPVFPLWSNSFPFCNQYFVGSALYKYLVLHQSFQFISLLIYCSISMEPSFKIYLFLLAWTWGFNVTIVIYVHARVSWVGQWEPLGPGIHPFNMYPSLLNTFFLAWQGVLGTFCAFLIPDLESRISPKNWFFLVKNGYLEAKVWVLGILLTIGCWGF